MKYIILMLITLSFNHVQASLAVDQVERILRNFDECSSTQEQELDLVTFKEMLAALKLQEGDGPIEMTDSTLYETVIRDHSKRISCSLFVNPHDARCYYASCNKD